MRLFLSVDMEGMPGIFSKLQTDPDGSRYEEGRKIMTDITLIFLENFHKYGFEEIMVADSHDGMGNIYYDRIPSYAKLMRGARRPLSMITGIDKGFDGLALIGYHSAAGTMHSSFDHTYSSTKFHEIRFDGKRMSEYLLVSLIAGKFNVPVILVSGDQFLMQEVLERTPWAKYVKLKDSIWRHSSISPSLEELRREIELRCQESISSLRNGLMRPFKLEGMHTVEFVMKNSEDADLAELIPGLKRVDAYTLVMQTGDPIEIYNIMQLIAYLS